MLLQRLDCKGEHVVNAVDGFTFFEAVFLQALPGFLGVDPDLAESQPGFPGELHLAHLVVPSDLDAEGFLPPLISLPEVAFKGILERLSGCGFQPFLDAESQGLRLRVLCQWRQNVNGRGVLHSAMPHVRHYKKAKHCRFAR